MRYNNSYKNPQQQASKTESSELQLRQMEADNRSMDLQQEMQQKREENPGAYRMNGDSPKKKEDKGIMSGKSMFKDYDKAPSKKI
jgi:hypothetical protein